jgi:hypothetical protein
MSQPILTRRELLLPWTGAHVGRVGIQPAGRWSTRYVRSAPAKVVFVLVGNVFWVIDKYKNFGIIKPNKVVDSRQSTTKPALL